MPQTGSYTPAVGSFARPRAYSFAARFQTSKHSPPFNCSKRASIGYSRQNYTVRRAVPVGQSCGAPAAFGKTPMVTVLEAVPLAKTASEPPNRLSAA